MIKQFAYFCMELGKWTVLSSFMNSNSIHSFLLFPQNSSSNSPSSSVQRMSRLRAFQLRPVWYRAMQIFALSTALPHSQQLQTVDLVCAVGGGEISKASARHARAGTVCTPRCAWRSRLRGEELWNADRYLCMAYCVEADPRRRNQWWHFVHISFEREMTENLKLHTRNLYSDLSLSHFLNKEMVAPFEIDASKFKILSWKQF